MIDLRTAVAWIARHEGFRATAYRDTRGFLTIGYGFNLDAPSAPAHCTVMGLDFAALCAGCAITDAQATGLLTSAAQMALDMGHVVLRGFAAMPSSVQLAVADMLYNLGSGGFLKFVQLRAALEAGAWTAAAEQMRQSRWYGEVGERAEDDIALVLQAA